MAPACPNTTKIPQTLHTYPPEHTLWLTITAASYTLQLDTQLVGMTILSSYFTIGINHQGSQLGDVEFKLDDTDTEGNIISICYRSGWLMVDNRDLLYCI
jgi:hypothetical protein